MQTSLRTARLKLAFVSPVNPVADGISDYSEELLPVLGDLADVTLYSDCGFPANPEIGRRFWPRPVAQLLTEAEDFDLALYQIGNSDHHRQAFDNLRRRPAVVTLHEPFLHHGLRAISLLRYRRELFYEQGHLREDQVKQWMQETDREVLLTSPLIGRLVDTSLGLVVHSQAARRMIETQIGRRGRSHAAPAWTVIPMIMPLLPEYNRAALRAAWNLPQDAVIFGVPGAIAPVKEPALVLQAFAQVSRSLSRAHLVFVGEWPADDSLRPLIQDLGIAEAVHVLGHMEPLARLHEALAACDIVINLRRPTIGETSATALRALALGRPLIVRGLGWFDELPDEACVKLGPEAAIDDLARILLDLSAAPGRCQQLGAAARRYIQAKCQPANIAQQYVEFLQEIYQRILARQANQTISVSHEMLNQL